MLSRSIAATCHGIDVPNSPFLNETRISRMERGRYEHQEIKGALNVLRWEDRVLELGAGLGVVSAVAAHNAKVEAVLSFEANPELIPHIKALHHANRLTDRIEVRNAVLLAENADGVDSVTFHLKNSFLGSSLIDSDTRATRPVQVPTADLEEVLEDFKPTILMIDIEGGELDFLKGADLSGFRAIIIEFHPGAYGIEGMKACKTILRDAGFQPDPDVSTRTVWTCVRTNVATHEDLGAPKPGGGWSSELRETQNATIVPPTTSGLICEAGVLEQDGSYASDAAHWRNFRPITICPPQPKGALDALKGRWLWGGVLWTNFAHQVAESPARLWPLGLEHAGRFDGVVMIHKRHSDVAEPTEFQKDFLSVMGVDVPVKLIVKPTSVETLVIPGQGFGLGEIIKGTDVFRAQMAERFGADIKASGPEKIYISRSALKSRGGLVGELQLENNLIAQGYTVFHPQDHDLYTQIGHYKAATHVLAAEGSALHLFAFVARSDQKVGMIVRRSSGASANIATHLASFSGRPPNIFKALKRVWMPKGQVRARLVRGELDLVALQRQLVRDGFIEKGPTWAPLDARHTKDLEDQGYSPETVTE